MGDWHMQALSPHFTIVTPTYNRRTSLARAIKSVQGQSFQDYEHIIVDDGSTDGTKEYVSQVGDPRIRFVRFEKWQGANACRNEGTRLSRSCWLSFLDSDDEYLPDRLQLLSRAIKEQPSTELFLSSFVTRKARVTRASSNPDCHLGGKQLEQAVISSSLLIAGSSITVKRSTILKSGGYAPSIRRLQDREALLSLSRVCGASVRSVVDWVKNVSEDSISRLPTGYVQSWSNLLERHPSLAREYRERIGCQIARHLISCIIRGNAISVFEAFRTNWSSPYLRFGVQSLLLCYAKRRDFQCFNLTNHNAKPPSASRRGVSAMATR